MTEQEPAPDPTPAQVRAAIRRDTRTLKGLAERMDEVMARRDDRIRTARRLGVRQEDVAADADMSIGRISHIAPTRRKTKQGQEPEQPAEEEHQEQEPERELPPARLPLPERELPPRFRPGALAAVKQSLSGLVTDNWSKPQSERVTIFADPVTGQWASPDGARGRIDMPHGTVGELIAGLQPSRVERVYLVGPRPVAAGAESQGPVTAGRLWFLGPLPEGWEHAGHWFPDDGAPIGRYAAGGGRRLGITLAAEWFGQSPYSVTEAAQAWDMLRTMIRTTKRGFGVDAILLDTPATTGRDLWRRTIGKNKDGSPKKYPVLSTELRELIQSTAGQGRREVIPEGPQTLQWYSQYDMRFAYAALAWGLPVGEPARVTGQKWAGLDNDARVRMLKGRGRWLVTATVPDGWQHVGILAAPSADSLWCYPRTPGQRMTTWATGTELALAAEHGWRFEVHEGITWAEGKPLTEWKDKLTDMYRHAELSEWARETPVVAKLVRTALRNLVLMAIGAFASRVHMVTKHAPMTKAGEKMLPATAPVRIVQGAGGQGLYQWQEPGERSEWVQRLDHPEWSAEIWGRCRGRLLSAPTGVTGVRAGALHVAPGQVLGMRTDALYLACDPEWVDDGAVGRYRRESWMVGEIRRPHTDAELGALKELAAAATEERAAR